MLTKSDNVLVDCRIDVLGYSYAYYSTYYMQPNKDLLPNGYSFPFQQTFGDNSLTFVFAYPPGVTEVDSDQWQLYN